MDWLALAVIDLLFSRWTPVQTADLCGRRLKGPFARWVFRALTQHCGVDLVKLIGYREPVLSSSIQRRFNQHSMERQTRRVWFLKIRWWSYMTPWKTACWLDEYRTRPMVIVGRQFDSMPTRLKKAIVHYAVLRVRYSASLFSTTLSTSRSNCCQRSFFLIR